MKKIITSLLTFALCFFNFAYAHETTINLKKQSSVVSLVFEPEFMEDSGLPQGYKYVARFDVKWGAYSRSFDGFNRIKKTGEHPVIVRFSDMDGAGYQMKVTTKGNTRFLGYYQGTSENDLREMYPYALILNCGSNKIRC